MPPGKLQQLLEAVARAGSWAVWMGVFDRGWLGLLQEGGMSCVDLTVAARGAGGDVGLALGK